MNSYIKTIEFYINKINERFETLITMTGDEYDDIKMAMLYSLTSGGKRVRGVLAIAFGVIGKMDIDVLVDVACAIEMIHCYSLIHDDLPCVDNDDMRRGKKACHKQFSESTAILAGDALLTMAFEVLSNINCYKNVKSTNILKAINELSQCSGISGMIGGQAMDLMNNNKDIDEETLMKIARLKTAELIKSSCKIGAIISGNSDYIIELAGKYGENLGIAFQIIDDILDILGDEIKTGKPCGSDDYNNKATFATIYSLDESRKKAKIHTKKAIDYLYTINNTEFLLEFTNNLLIREY